MLIGYTHQAQSKNFLEASFKKFDVTVFSVPYGALCDFKLFAVCYCTGDVIPDVRTIKKVTKRKFTIVIWDRLSDDTKKQGWVKFTLPGVRPTLGVVGIRNGIDKHRWSETAQRYARKWENQKDVVVSSVGIDEYLREYKKGTLSEALQNLFTRTIKDHLSVYNQDTVLYLAKDSVGETLAGLVVTYDNETKQSIHISSFVTERAKKTLAGFGLIMHLFSESKEKNMDFVNFGVMYEQGDPSSWKGYTTFKEQFAPVRVRHQIPLVKIIIK